MSTDNRPDDFNEAEKNAPNPVGSNDSNIADYPPTNLEELQAKLYAGKNFCKETANKTEPLARPLAPGEIIVLSDYYIIKAHIGIGGQKAVYEVVSKRLGTRFVVKELRAKLGALESQRLMLEREAKLQASLQHQGIPKVFLLKPDADPTSETLPRFVETYVEGEPWSARPFDRAHFEENLDILLKVAKIMKYAHERGYVVHRDLKPENVMINNYGEIYVVDWGMAFNLKEEGPQRGASGTISYMAPEHASGKPVGYQADVFSLGSILYKILTGFAPYEIALRTQGSYHAAKKAQACDFAPLDPEAAKAELLKLTEEALTSSDAAPELRDLAEKALFALASPGEILTFAEKGLVEVESLQYNYTGRRSGLEAQNALSALAKSHLFAVDASVELRRLAQTALIALVATIPAKLLEILETALAEDVSQRFQNASAFVNALETHRPQSAALKRFQNIKQRFNLLQEALNVELNDNTRSKLARNIIEGVELLNKLQTLRPSASFRSTNEIFSAFRDLFPNLDSRDGFFSDVFGSFNVESRTSALHPETESDVQLIQEIAETELKFRDFLIEKTIRFKDFMTATALVAEQREAIDFVFNAPSRESEKTTALQKLTRQEEQAKLAYEHVERGKIWSLKIVATLAGTLAILATLLV
ncbi:MAG: serine/threonine protein kinase, partial [Thermoguttaceae bacterium]|nr:serine/threonine protein kinase [Thermoguttaceae bacterium]